MRKVAAANIHQISKTAVNAQGGSLWIFRVAALRRAATLGAEQRTPNLVSRLNLVGNYSAEYKNNKTGRKTFRSVLLAKGKIYSNSA